MSVNEELLARENIRDVIYRYCRAVVSRDWESVRACFAQDASISHGSYSGPVDKFLDFAVGIFPGDMMKRSVGCISFSDTILKLNTNPAYGM